MYHIDFNNPIHVHFIGIGGISMSGLAEILHEKGFTISGSDSKESELVDSLISKGISVNIGQTADNITDTIDLVVYTAAIRKDNPEFAAVIEKNIPIITRAELLGQIMSNYSVAVGVSGTHGKTTTTSMLTEILVAADADPTITVGGILPSIGGNLRVGKSSCFVTEACEYTNSFLSFNPTVGIILNVQEDHLDFFKDINDIRHSFKLYAERLPKNGTLIINSDIDDYSYFYSEADCNVITVGSDPAISNYSAADITYGPTGCCTYTLLKDNSPVTTIELGVPGIHNVYNSLAAIAAGLLLNVSIDTIKTSLSKFKGTNRRFELKGKLNGFTIVDDYAHHPAEITATLNSAVNYPHKKLLVAFQPHTYTRTKAFLKDFAIALSKADVVVLADIFAAREKNTIGISSVDLLNELKKLGSDCHYFSDFKDIEKFILDTCGEGDLVITMGAGNIVDVGEDLLK